MSEEEVTANAQHLTEFYEAERKRLGMELEEIIEKLFGKMEAGVDTRTPNFIIEGSKLIFLNKDGAKIESKNQLEIQPRLHEVKLSHDPNRLRVELIK